MKQKIVFRTDGGPDMGLGHLIRSLALARMLRQDFNISFYCRQIPGSLVQEIRSDGFSLTIIKEEADFIRNLSPEIIAVIDGYSFDTDYQLQIKEQGSKLVCIDDLYNQEFYADLIINHSRGVSPEDYTAQPYTTFALGLDYALLRPSFIEQAKKERTIDQIETALICVGGSDPKNLTQKILQGARTHKQLTKILVITGSGYQKKESLHGIIDSDDRVRHFQSLNEQEMISKMLEAELAIVPSSSIILETMCCSCKILSFWYAPNQQTFHEYAVKKGFLASFGDNSNGFNSGKFHQQLEKMLTNNIDVDYTEFRQKMAGAKENLLAAFRSLVED